MTEPANTLRLDRWLWYARFFKSRSLAAKLCAGNRVRINRRIVTKASATVKVDDVLTFPLGPHIRVIKVLDLGTRRGPAAEAATLYEDLAPPVRALRDASANVQESGSRDAGAGRPTKRERRKLDRLRDSPA